MQVHAELYHSDVVIKVGGNAFFPRGTMAIDPDLVEALRTFVSHRVDTGKKCVLLPGGVGGQVFIEWARSIGCPDPVLNEVGCSLLDLAANILAAGIAGDPLTGFKSAPAPARDFGHLRELLDRYDLVVAGHCMPGALTSDSLSALTAEALGFSLLLVKNSLPFGDLSTVIDSRADLFGVSLKAVRDQADQQLDSARPGRHQSLDGWAIKILARHPLPCYITTAAAVNQFSASGNVLRPLLKLTD